MVKTTYVNYGQEDQMTITGYQSSVLRMLFLFLLVFMTGGVILFIMLWYPVLYIVTSKRKCDLQHATVVVLKDDFQQNFISYIIEVADVHDRPKTGNIFRSIDDLSAEKAHLLSRSSEKEEYDCIKYFLAKNVRYIWNAQQSQYEKLRGIEDQNMTCGQLHDSKGLPAEIQKRKLDIYGPNKMQLKLTPIAKIFFYQVFSPFYMFQMFSAIVWIYDWYYYYAGFTLFTSVVAIIVAMYQTRATEKSLLETLHFSSTITVCRAGKVWESVSSECLVPGDVIEVPKHGCVMQCDAVLLSGNCIVNEGMITGESIPIIKTPLPNPKLSGKTDHYFNLKEHARHVLFSGTTVIQTRYYGNRTVQAVVMRTGFATAKGELVRSILFPKPVDFRFERDTYIYLTALALMASIGLIYTFVLLFDRGVETEDLVLRCLDLITIAVPPALPAALTIGIVFAQSRLKKGKIFCVSPKRITVSGMLNTVCFDKTGTLTEEGLNISCIIPTYNGLFHTVHRKQYHLGLSEQMLTCMASCHLLTNIDGVLSGDPIDLIIFKVSNWEITEPGEETERFDLMMPTIVRPKLDSFQSQEDTYARLVDPVPEVGILRQFPFTSSLRRMSVITRKLGDKHFVLYTKGAPETIKALCKPETVPQNFDELLVHYTQEGYRVLALSWRSLPTKLKYAKLIRIEREQIERNLDFLGFIVLENRLKPETERVIADLKNAQIKTIMVTGDNMLTALSVARECGMIEEDTKVILVQAYLDRENCACVEYIYNDPQPETYKELRRSRPSLSKDENDYTLAIDGTSWALIREEDPMLLERILVKATVYARMSPDQKAQLVESLQCLGYYVGMCGDGANDCGALKAAHAGIALSESEASVASPFTSKVQNISCVPALIRNGRAALVTAFGIFKFMAIYSIVNFVSVCILYCINSNLTDFQFLYIDLVLLTFLSITFSWTGDHDSLHPDPPLIKLFSIGPILSLVVQTLVQTGFQLVAYFHIQEQPWFLPYIDNPEYDYTCYETTSLFLVSIFQFWFLGMAYSKGPPYRKPMYTNYLFLATLVMCFGFNTWFTFYPGTFMAEFMQILPPPSIIYRLLIFALVIINGLVIFGIEDFFLGTKLVTVKLQQKIEQIIHRTSQKYQEIEDHVRKDPDWPPKAQIPTEKDNILRTKDNAQEEFDHNSLLGSVLLSNSGSYGYSLRSSGSIRLHNSSDTYFSPDSSYARDHPLTSTLPRARHMDNNSMGVFYSSLLDQEVSEMNPLVGHLDDGLVTRQGEEEV